MKGGMDLGLERDGMECAWQVEIDDYCKRVLTKHWPDVQRHSDIRDCGRHNLAPVDLICGGFPCQDISNAGKRAGIDGERSGLWSEFHRIICELRPRYVLVENVAALLNRGIERVLGDLAASGYDAEWDCLPASAVGAPHLRDRLFIIAYSQGLKTGGAFAQHSKRETSERWALKTPPARGRTGLPGVADWGSTPAVCRVDDGISVNVDRLAVLGNAVVPQVAEWIGRRILEAA